MALTSWNSRIARMMLPSLLLLWVWATPAQAQCIADELNDNIYLVRSVSVETLLGGAPQELEKILAKHRGERYRSIEVPVKINGIDYTKTSRDIYRQEVSDFFFSKDSADRDTLLSVNQQNTLYFRVKYISDCVRLIKSASECAAANLKDQSGAPVSECVDVKIRIRVIPVNTASLSSNLLDLARSNKLRFYRELPRPLVAFNPKVWVDRDRDYGTAAVGNISTNLLDVKRLLAGKEPVIRDKQLLLKIDGRKSLQEPFYNTTSTLSFSMTKAPQLLDTLGMEAAFTANRQPQGDGQIFTNALRLRGNALLKFKGGPLSQLSLGLGYRRANNRFFSPTNVLPEQTSENAFESRAAVDGVLARGFMRGAVWFDSANPKRGAGSYRRLATMIGYSREFIFPQRECQVVTGDDGQPACVFPKKNPPAIGVELLLGAGRAWGNVPEYARFYGGNQRGNFIYDGLNEPSLTELPAGPLIRSFGQSRAGIRTTPSAVSGGTSYWHLNLSVSLPVSAWSRPLIPAQLVSSVSDTSGALTCAGCKTLKSVLKEQVASGKFIFIDSLAIQKLDPQQRDDLANLDPDDGLTPEEQARWGAANAAFEAARNDVTPEADKLWSELMPTINYISDHANLFAVKPLLMFDAARISAQDEPGQRTRLAFGGGLQFNVVVAKFEAGYLRTIRRQPGDQGGNFVIRMVFEKLF